MGAVLSARNVRHDEITSQIPSNHGYIFPSSVPGMKFFSSHYYLGSKKVETADPESFLFGDMPDLNYMTHVPCPFPYKQPPKKKPIDCLNALVFVHKETVKLVRVPDSDDYSVQFKFDSECDCNIYIICSLSILANMNELKYGSTQGSDSWISRKYTYQKGLEQEFSEASLRLPLADFRVDKLTFDPTTTNDSYPFVLLLETAETSGCAYQSLITIGNFEKVGETGYTLKVLKQKFLIDGLEYIFHEIFGLENKAIPKEGGENTDDDSSDDSDADSDDEDDLGAECVICFTDVKDTIILPCRHFCLCASCAADLRYQASNCPICRAPFLALMQIQAVQKIKDNEQPDDDEISNNPELYSVSGYKVMSLLQGLNGYPKIKKNSEFCSGPPIVTTSAVDEEEETTATEPLKPATAEDTAIVIESTPNEVIISLDDNSSNTDDKEISTSPLLEDRQNILPDLIPPGSIPGTPEKDESDDKPDSVAMIIEANVEHCCSTGSISNGNQFESSGETHSSVSTQPTELSSLKSSTSFDSVNSGDVLIKKSKQ